MKRKGSAPMLFNCLIIRRLKNDRFQTSEAKPTGGMSEETLLVTIREMVDCNSQIRRPQADRRGRAKPCGGILSPVNKMEVVD